MGKGQERICLLSGGTFSLEENLFHTMATIEGNIQQVLAEILKLMVKENASDVYLKVGSPPILRIEGELVSIKFDRLTPEQTELLAFSVMNDYQKETFRRVPEINTIYSASGVGRFRVNIYRQRGSIGIVMRKVKEDIPSFEDLHLPAVLKDVAVTPRGFVVVTGPTGCGKSTTLAAMIDWINDHRTGHIITIEDPVEFLHKDKKCLVSQREIGTDTNNFADALKNVVRQTPDVVMIGEMRDKESVGSAVFFAETGHLVLSSLHSVNSVQAIERIIQFFPTEVHPELLLQLSLNMRAIISQRLVPKADGQGRVPAVEVMLNNARVRDLLKAGELTTLKREIDAFNSEGMQSIDTALFQLYQTELISFDTALAHADSPNDLRLKIKTTPSKKPIRPPAGYVDDRYAPPPEAAKRETS